MVCLAISAGRPQTTRTNAPNFHSTRATIMFKTHLAFSPPEPHESKLWRYMDFTKFVSMLARKSLYFTSLKKMSEQDPFEGMLPDTFFECRSWKTVDDVPEHERWRLTLYPMNGQTPLQMAQSSMEDFARAVQHSRKILYINCWHMNNYESAAMWSIYARRGSGIAVTSTYEMLQNSLPSDKAIFGSKITYSDYSVDLNDGVFSNNLLTSAIRKRRSFEFEKEFRAVFWDDSGNNTKLNDLPNAIGFEGVEFPCDLSTLIDGIYVSPKSENWFLDLVQSVVTTYGLNKEVRRSALDFSPTI